MTTAFTAMPAKITISAMRFFGTMAGMLAEPAHSVHRRNDTPMRSSGEAP